MNRSKQLREKIMEVGKNIALKNKEDERLKEVYSLIKNLNGFNASFKNEESKIAIEWLNNIESKLALINI